MRHLLNKLGIDTIIREPFPRCQAFNPAQRGGEPGPCLEVPFARWTWPDKAVTQVVCERHDAELRKIWDIHQLPEEAAR